MANIRKTFNFRNGVQVDDDNLVVDSLGKVGIGTSVPTEVLDVRGIAKIVGVVTASNIFTPSLTVGVTTTGSLGIATINSLLVGGNISISSGIVTAATGFVTYYGDGGGLYNIPTSQWVDIDVGLGFTSIYAAGYVGVATVDPRFAFQVGGNNDVGNFQGGVGINSTGDILATGIITATSFSGAGSLITAINASNISSGTIGTDRIPVLRTDQLPDNINASGIITASGFVGSGIVISSGNVNATGIITASGFVGSGITISAGDINATGIITASGFVGSGITINSGNINAAGIITASGFVGSGITISSGNINLTGNINTAGIITASGFVGSGITISAGDINATGIITASGFVGSGITISAGDINLTGNINAAGIITANSFSGNSTSATYATNAGVATYANAAGVSTSVSGGTGSLTQLSVSGISTLSGEVIIDTGIVPDISAGAYIGTTGKPFFEAYINYVAIGGVDQNKITTTTGNLLLDSATNLIFADANLRVTGITTLNDTLNVDSNILATADNVVSLGSTTKRFNQAHISAIQVGVANTNEITSIDATDLRLNSATGTTIVDDDLKVTGLGTFTGAISAGGTVTAGGGFLPSTDLGSNLGSSGLRFNNVYANTASLSNLNLTSLQVQSISALGSSLLLSSSQETVKIQDYVQIQNITQVDNSLIGSVGIGTTIPSGEFQVGTLNDFGKVVVALASTIGISTTIITGISTSSITTGLKILAIDGVIKDGTTVTSIGSSQIGIGTTTLNTDNEINDLYLTFGTGYTDERVFTVTSSKSVGIGTTNPTSKLHVIGDARVGVNTSQGVILTSANGTKYRLIVSNAGVLSTVLVP